MQFDNNKLDKLRNWLQGDETFSLGETEEGHPITPTPMEFLPELAEYLAGGPMKHPHYGPIAADMVMNLFRLQEALHHSESAIMVSDVTPKDVVFIASSGRIMRNIAGMLDEFASGIKDEHPESALQLQERARNIKSYGRAIEIQLGIKPNDLPSH